MPTCCAPTRRHSDPIVSNCQDHFLGKEHAAVDVEEDDSIGSLILHERSQTRVLKYLLNCIIAVLHGFA